MFHLSGHRSIGHINDIVFARTGGSTGRNYFYDGHDGEFVYAGFLIKFSIDPQKVNPKFIWKIGILFVGGKCNRCIGLSDKSAFV